ncbi:hypothetical protein GMORB2_3542 [Geosmithia morbida]|uniref:Uncharacterized protein n=1 Tax=Geosmithia morbida TaxID=1094350 RepID=A0A9P5D2U9_9HYPO|nr:uncharacterized protein GMORB2_3542 [Geosmithia morbida]KAF4119854.1 hypothetical protein GMORB2_3542 [Geosmithia morbida]
MRPSRAEEVYQEERAIMDAMQDAWEAERTALLGEMRLLKERVRCLEMENRALRSSPPSSTDASAALGASYRSPADPSSLPPGLDGAARRPHHRVNIGTPHGAASSSSSAEPAWSSVLPLDPRMQPQTRNPKDFLARDVVEGGESDTVIDIHEVDPKLEGIPLRATAVQRLGFFGGQQSSRTSAATSPPTAAASGPDADTTDDPRRLGLVKRNSSRDTTIQVLHAAESRRLTMYAGHTPNHSLSLFPTMSISATRQGSAAASRGPSTHGLGTPPQQAAEEKVRGGEDAQEYDTLGDERGPEVYVTAAYDGPPPEYPDSQGEVCYDDGGGGDDGLPEHLEPIDDVRLKGPLMVKNIPAQDEIFWDQVNKKLEPISQGKGALPAAMMGEDDDDDDDDLHAASSFSSPPQPRSPVADVTDEPPAVVDGDNSPRNHRDDDAVDKNIEPDVPLKIRSTTNFGAPFGVV